MASEELKPGVMGFVMWPIALVLAGVIGFGLIFSARFLFGETKFTGIDSTYIPYVLGGVAVFAIILAVGVIGGTFLIGRAAAKRIDESNEKKARLNNRKSNLKAHRDEFMLSPIGKYLSSSLEEPKAKSFVLALMSTPEFDIFLTGQTSVDIEVDGKKRTLKRQESFFRFSDHLAARLGADILLYKGRKSDKEPERHYVNIAVGKDNNNYRYYRMALKARSDMDDKTVFPFVFSEGDLVKDNRLSYQDIPQFIERKHPTRKVSWEKGWEAIPGLYNV